MTICVAAICGRNQCVALASDRLIVNDGNVISGSSESKVKVLSANASLIYSGSSTHIQRLIRQLSPDELNASVLATAQAVQRSYSECLNAIVEERFLLPELGMKYNDYVMAMVRKGEGEKLGDVYANRNNLHFSSVVIGVDEDGAHIIQASPSLIAGSAGFDAIGSGADIAQWARRFLLLQKHDNACSVIEGLFTVCLAKTVAQELGLAIGEDTDLAVQTRTGLVHIESPLKEKLMHECRGRIDRLKLSNSELDELASLMPELPIDG